VEKIDYYCTKILRNRFERISFTMQFCCKLYTVEKHIDTISVFSIGILNGLAWHSILSVN